MEPTNNAAERALRPAVIYRKLSFGTQSAAGSRYLERILTVSETCRLQGRSAYGYLIAAMEAKLAGTATPSLLPTITQKIDSSRLNPHTDLWPVTNIGVMTKKSEHGSAHELHTLRTSSKEFKKGFFNQHLPKLKTVAVPHFRSSLSLPAPVVPRDSTFMGSLFLRVIK